jgi:hypothetical protein
MTIDLPWPFCDTRQRESEKTALGKGEHDRCEIAALRELPLHKSSRDGCGASGGAIHEDPEKEAIVLHGAPGNTAPRRSRYFFCRCISFGVLRSGKVRLVAAIEVQLS